MQVYNVFLVYTPSDAIHQIWDHLATCATEKDARICAEQEGGMAPTDCTSIDEYNAEFVGTCVVRQDIWSA